MSVKSSGFDVLRITIYNIVGRCLWSLSVGSPDYIFNDVFFHDSLLCLNFVRLRETWQATSCPPFHGCNFVYF